MKEAFYKIVRLIGRRVFLNASAPRVLHAERAARAGGYILAANHGSPYDAPLIIASNPRVIYWLSIVEIFRNPLVGCFLRCFGAEPLDRSGPDPRTVRTMSLSWGVTPMVVDTYTSTDELVWFAVETAVKAGYVQRGQVVLVLAGAPDRPSGAATDVLRIVQVA